MEITVGMKGIAETVVEREDTAAQVGSGSLLVYATPCMVRTLASPLSVRTVNLFRLDRPL